MISSYFFPGGEPGRVAWEEMKFSVKPYHITDSYEDTLRNRLGIFQEKTRTTKSLVYTFVTTFGVANGSGRSIVNSEVTMDDLFMK